MNYLPRILGITAVAVLATTGIAQATTLNFASLAQAGSGFNSIGPSYTQSGFTLSSTALTAWESGAASLPSLSAADTSLFEFYADYTTTLTAAGNAAFTLNSVDLAPLIAGGSGTFNVTFVATFANSSTLSDTCTVSDGSPATLQTCALAGFSNVVSVSFQQGTNIGYFGSQETGFQFDNLVINGATSVPEPATFGLMALGLVAAVASRRRRAVA